MRIYEERGRAWWGWKAKQYNVVGGARPVIACLPRLWVPTWVQPSCWQWEQRQWPSLGISFLNMHSNPCVTGHCSEAPALMPCTDFLSASIAPISPSSFLTVLLSEALTSAQAEQRRVAGGKRERRQLVRISLGVLLTYPSVSCGKMSVLRKGKGKMIKCVTMQTQGDCLWLWNPHNPWDKH